MYSALFIALCQPGTFLLSRGSTWKTTPRPGIPSQTTTSYNNTPYPLSLRISWNSDMENHQGQHPRFTKILHNKGFSTLWFGHLESGYSTSRTSKESLQVFISCMLRNNNKKCFTYLGNSFPSGRAVSPVTMEEGTSTHCSHLEVKREGAVLVDIHTFNYPSEYPGLHTLKAFLSLKWNLYFTTLTPVIGHCLELSGPLNNWENGLNPHLAWGLQFQVH